MCKILYNATGKYQYNCQWNDIPKDCQYFYAYPGRQRLTLKGMIAKHLKLSSGQYNYIKLGKSVKINKENKNV